MGMVSVTVTLSRRALRVLHQPEQLPPRVVLHAVVAPPAPSPTHPEQHRHRARVQLQRLVHGQKAIKAKAIKAKAIKAKARTRASVRACCWLCSSLAESCMQLSIWYWVHVSTEISYSSTHIHAHTSAHVSPAGRCARFVVQYGRPR